MLEVKWKVQYCWLSVLIVCRFNPCYVGSKMERHSSISLRISSFVSILVMLEVKWKVLQHVILVEVTFVSILVMLEVKWKAI